MKLQPIVGSRGWNLSLSLTQNAKRGDEISGNALVSVEGQRGDQIHADQLVERCVIDYMNFITVPLWSDRSMARADLDA